MKSSLENLTEEGHGLTKLEQKCRPLLSATLIKQFLRESSGTSFLHYWIKIDSEVVKPVKRGHYIPNKRYILMFCDLVKEKEQIPKDKPNITWTKMNVYSYQVAYYYTDNLYQPDLLCLTQKPAIIFLSGVTNY